MIDTSNKFLVSASGDAIAILNLPARPFSKDDALVFAAWLVALAEPGATYPFADVLDAVQNT